MIRFHRCVENRDDFSVNLEESYPKAVFSCRSCGAVMRTCAIDDLSKEDLENTIETIQIIRDLRKGE